MTTPTLHDLFQNYRVKAISFWCSRPECLRHDIEHKGMVAIDYGPERTLEDLEAVCQCMSCGSQPLQVRPNWGEGGQNFFEGLGASAGRASAVKS